MPFSGLRLTEFGKSVLAKAQAGKGLILTRVALGDGKPDSVDTADFKALLSEKLSCQIGGKQANGDTTTLLFELSSSKVDAGFYYRELGVFARDPDTGDEGLYLYDCCRTEGEYIGDKDDRANQVSALMRIKIKFSDTDRVVIENEGNPLYVLYDEYLAETGRLSLAADAARIMLNNHESRIKMLEDALFNDITTNPFTVRFNNLNGVIMTGVYNEARQRIEC